MPNVDDGMPVCDKCKRTVGIVHRTVPKGEACKEWFCDDCMDDVGIDENYCKPDHVAIERGEVSPMAFNKTLEFKAKGEKVAYEAPIARLWSLLDDIDTASDMFKPTNLEGYKAFYGYAMKKAEERHKLLQSDGYNLYHTTGDTK